MNDLVTIVVNSCDSYEDTWNPLFKLLKKYWPDRKYPIILNTETKKYDFEDMNIKVINTYNKKLNWGGRLKNVLKQTDSKYILFMLDDFFITDYVNQKKLDEIVEWMENDDNIAVFSLYPIFDSPYEDISSNKYKGFNLRNKKGWYRFNCQAAIWRRDVLIKSLRNFESAWDWELIGNRRSRRIKKEFYALDSIDNLIFKYDYLHIGIIRGRWGLPETKDFFDKEGIKIDYNIRNNKEKVIKKENKYLEKVKIYLKKIRSLV